MVEPLILKYVPSKDNIAASKLNHLDSKEVWYGIGLFLFIIGIFNWSFILYSKLTPPGQTRDLESIRTTHQHFSLSCLPTALLNLFRVVMFRWTLHLPFDLSINGAEIVLMVAYIIYLYIWTFTHTTSLGKTKLDWRYWSGRSGIIATSQFPLLTALGTKNNIISVITGVSYEKMNFLHRMMSRVVFILLWVHSGGEIVHVLPRMKHLKPWVIHGIIGIIAFSILFITSVRPIRRKAYELFFYIHFAMVLIMLVCGYYHVKKFKYITFIWPCFLIWGLDRIIRLCYVTIFSCLPGATMNATAQLHSEQCVHLHVTCPKHFHWSPGQSIYLIMPSVSLIPFEAHPFTIASFDSPTFNSNSSTTMESKALTEGKDQTIGSDRKELVFFINVQNGFTLQLKKLAQRKENVKVFIDGPYGLIPDLRRFDTSVLIAGGTGISYVLPTFLSIIERVQNGKSCCQRLVLIWAVRDESNWVDKTLSKALHLVPLSLTVSIHIHVTGQHVDIEPGIAQEAPEPEESAKGSSSASAEGMGEKNELLGFPSVTIEKGRPDLIKILQEEVDSGPKRLSVSVCGSSEIVKTVRKSLCFPVSSPSKVLHGGPSVSLFIESYGYA
ncbi:ferric reductase NAD binding domain-containing protein [Scleroderma yunnanense]